MKASVQTLCEQFIQNRDTIKETFKMGSVYLYPVCANLFCSKGMTADGEKINRCRELIKEKTGVFSSFRGNIQMALACMLSMEQGPEEKLDKALACYDLLKKEFMVSDYLPLAAFLLADFADAEEKVKRGKGLYQRMKEEHPFLTSGEDSVFAVMMAFSEKTDDQLIADMEACYEIMKEKRFCGSNYMQTISHILALAQGLPETKVARVMELFDEVERAGRKYGKYHELAILASIAMMEGDAREMTTDMMDADGFLAGQKGYGFWGVDKKTRLMHGAMIVSNIYGGNETVAAATVTSSLSMVIAQQMAVYASVAAASAANAAVNSSH